MDIKAAHIDINARTKTERGNVPVFSECELRISIWHFGFADIAIWQKAGKGPQQGDFGRIATLTIYNPADMVRLANGLLALANAAEVIERSNALGQEPCAAVCARSPAPEGYTSGTTEKE